MKNIPHSVKRAIGQTLRHRDLLTAGPANALVLYYVIVGFGQRSRSHKAHSAKRSGMGHIIVFLSAFWMGLWMGFRQHRHDATGPLYHLLSRFRESARISHETAGEFSFMILPFFSNDD